MDYHQSSLSNTQFDIKDISQINLLNKPKIPNSNVNK